MNIKSIRTLKNRRKPVRVTGDMLVHQHDLLSDSRLPLLIEPKVSEVDLISWVESNQDTITDELYRRGGILFRGFEHDEPSWFSRFIEAATSKDLLTYTYRSTPRTEVAGNIYTSTEYPADQSIPLHNENVYAHDWPMKICFYADIVASQGGETPIADSRKIYQRLSNSIRDKFAEHGVMYVRNYGDYLDLPWREVFQTEDKAEVETFCHEHGIKCEWNGEQLTTRQICQSVANHPRTGEEVWCNQAHLFHVSNLEPALRASLLSTVGEDRLPRNSFYGDGSRIDDAVLDEIRQIYEDEAVVFGWQQGDVLLLDNMLIAHGRKPYQGPRRVLVGMADPYSAVVA